LSPSRRCWESIPDFVLVLPGRHLRWHTCPLNQNLVNLFHTFAMYRFSQFSLYHHLRF
jgi:hypothetical protein